MNKPQGEVKNPLSKLEIVKDSARGAESVSKRVSPKYISTRDTGNVSCNVNRVEKL